MTKMKIARMTICDRFTVALRWVLFVARLADINHWRARSKFTTLPNHPHNLLLGSGTSHKFTTWHWHTQESLDSEVGEIRGESLDEFSEANRPPNLSPFLILGACWMSCRRHCRRHVADVGPSIWSITKFEGFFKKSTSDRSGKKIVWWKTFLFHKFYIILYY